ncbi:membrane-associated phospholipid phosphatase [Chryseobacterium sp. H1D6B]|uniref:phosphatase PAP2 family protein n=1 Tax=Chryseobacterium sp. H1D6B TaxID=2940588 RepID=UPI0015CD91E3|nr:phosphatase PAP2 family protein [Chryseobacterium sp. H1D6B]MDH6253843.1 membrane-associated phospholipid phosphatase [Chryseobacterium sp. H1D6B]
MKFIHFRQTHKKLLFYSLFAVLLASFILLSGFVLLKSPEYLDLHISKEIQEKHSENLNTLMIGISWFGRTPISIVMVILTSLFFLSFRLKKEALFIAATLLSGILGLLFKIVINRPRPSKDLVILLEETKYQSFPSGHVLFYTVFFGSLIIIILHLKNIKFSLKIFLAAVCFSMIFLGAVSRVYLGAHWFTDVLGGFILGIICLLIMGYFYLKNNREASEDILLK